MIWIAARTILKAIVALFVAAAIAFLLLELVPGGQPAGVADANARFWSWIGEVLTGGLGDSASQAAPVGQLIAERLAVTGPLIVLAMIVAALSGVGLGLAAARGGPVVDRPLMALAGLGASVGAFWAGMLLILLFSVVLHWLPAGGFVPWISNSGSSFVSLIMPALALGLPAGAAIALALRDAIANERGASYVRAAQGRGMTADRALWRHGGRNALLALLWRSEPIVMSIIAGAAIVEVVFSLQGMGRLLVDAAISRDVPLVRGGLVVVFAGLTVAGLLVRFAVAWADPRISRRSPS
jgi:peptide/nickel transport system permease protein